MTEKQRRIYMLFCMAGRTNEAEEYRSKCEAKEAARTASSPSGTDGEKSKKESATQKDSEPLRPDIQYLTGDATAPQGAGQKIIAHICNDMGAWGSGFVVALSRRWVTPERQYRIWHNEGKGFQLGAVQFIPVESDIIVANMLAQHGIRKSGQNLPPIRYQALEQCLQQVARRAAETKASVHMPRIGCGRSGGTWTKVEPIVRRCLTDAGIPVYIYDLPIGD